MLKYLTINNSFSFTRSDSSSIMSQPLKNIERKDALQTGIIIIILKTFSISLTSVFIRGVKLV